MGPKGRKIIATVLAVILIAMMVLSMLSSAFLAL